MAEYPALDPERLPLHIGIIMDGNGRWAVKRGLPRTSGHKEGLQAAKRIVKAASDIGIQFLTLYAFSTENWKRAEEEVSFLMKLIGQHLRKEYKFYVENGIKVVHSGDLINLPRAVQKEIDTVTRDTAGFTGLTVNLAINYGGRNEIIRSLSRLLERQGNVPLGSDAISEEDVEANLDCPLIPEADFIIRTGGEYRLSNFLTWQSVYAELYFDTKLWPDWAAMDLYRGIEE
jgi:undecaprenyl diphosphate synthase